MGDGTAYASRGAGVGGGCGELGGEEEDEEDLGFGFGERLSGTRFIEGWKILVERSEALGGGGELVLRFLGKGWV